jgi:hypothetical protein
MKDSSDPDPLLEALARVAREETQETDQWWRAASEADPAGLPEGAPGPDVLAPLGEAEQAAMAQALFGLPAEAEVPAAVVSLAAYRRRWLPVAAGMALAAGIAAMVVLSAPPTLPGYQLEVRAGEQVLRSDPTPSAAEPTYTEGSVLAFVLRPEARAELAVTVAAVLYPEAGVARVVPFEVEAADGGALRLTAELGQTFSAPPGRYRLVFLLAPVGGLPADPTQAEPSEGQRLEHRFQVVAQP